MISQLYSATVSNVTELESIRVLRVCWWDTWSFIVVKFKHFVDHYGLLDTDSAFTARTRRPQYFFTLGGRSTVEFHLVTHFVQRRVPTVWMHCTWAANLHQVLNETKKYDLRSSFCFEYCQRKCFLSVSYSDLRAHGVLRYRQSKLPDGYLHVFGPNFCDNNIRLVPYIKNTNTLHHSAIEKTLSRSGN